MRRIIGKTFAASAALAILCLLTCCTLPVQNERNESVIIQAGYFDSFAAGDFKGFVELSEVAGGNNIGLGTFEGVDGELIILDGVCYRVAFDGKVEVVDSKEKTPFAMATKFTPEFELAIKGETSMAKLAEAIDKASNNSGRFLAIKAKVHFSKLKLRAPPKAKEPYSTLAVVISKQHVFECKNISGTLIGFKTPPAYKSMDVPGYHFHFISDDRKIGGHVLDLMANEGSVEIQSCDTVKLLLPPTARISRGNAGSIFPGESVDE